MQAFELSVDTKREAASPLFQSGGHGFQKECHNMNNLTTEQFSILPQIFFKALPKEDSSVSG